jgi:hypothetical protein
MLDDAVYYSRREGEERVLAEQAADPRVQQTHRLLAEKYSELARRAMASLNESQDE